jgi:hypothetical protein
MQAARNSASFNALSRGVARLCGRSIESACALKP